MLFLYAPVFSTAIVLITLIFHFLFSPPLNNNKIKLTKSINTPPKKVLPAKKIHIKKEFVEKTKKKYNHKSKEEKIEKNIKIVYPPDGDYLPVINAIVVAGEEHGKLSITIDDTTFIVNFNPKNGFMEIRNDYLKKLSNGIHYLKIEMDNEKQEIMFNKIMEVAER